MPAALHSQILAQAYNGMAIRLGLAPSEEESTVFASSLYTWPLFDDAVRCLQDLKPRIPVLVGLFDVDHVTLLQTPSFSILAPYFAEVFTWDASHKYRPDFAAFHPPFVYHDDLGVARADRCLVSNSVFRDLEPAGELKIPAIWMRYPSSVAGNLSTKECSSF